MRCTWRSKEAGVPGQWGERAGKLFLDNGLYDAV